MSKFRVRCNVLSSWLRAALAVALLLPVACRETGHGDGFVNAGAAADTQTVQTSVNDVVTTRHLASSTQETKQAAPGDRFVVLDVTARNGGSQPQVFSEGKLVSVSESHERSFPTPVSMLADEFLTLQVLKPGDTVRGRIAYEVPEALPGVLYWVPGNGNQRILLHVAPPGASDAAAPVTTSADASQAEADDVTPPPANRPAPRRDVLASAAMPPGAASASKTTRTIATPSTAASSNARVASIGTPPTASSGNEQARTLACQALASRNDPAEKSRYLAFFSRECAGYAMPSAWLGPDERTPIGAPDTAVSTIGRPLPQASDAARAPVGETPRWPPRPGPAFDCSQAYTRAEHLVCEDAVLSLMDWELNRAYAQASRVVDDPDGLQRDEDAWRHRVRDACDTARCVESVYDQRTAQLEALADRQR